MIDETVLEELLAQIAQQIPVPGDGPDRVVRALAVASTPTRRSRQRFAKPLLAAAVVVVIAAIAVPMAHTTSSSKTTVASSPFVPSNGGVNSTHVRDQASGFSLGRSAGSPPGSIAVNAPVPSAPAGGPLDAAKIVKTGTLDLQVAHSTLRVSVNRVTGVAVGLGGYIADSKTSLGGSDPSAQVTIRIPVRAFETAIARLDALPGVKVLGDSENGTDVTAQFVDVQAQLTAATAERDQLLIVLSHAQSIGDILAVHDRVSAVQTEVDRLQGRLNVLNDQAAMSSVAVTLSEKPGAPVNAIVKSSKPPSGLSKSWSDARRGFADVIEWLIARSGGTLIIVLFGLMALFGIRYLYPVVRRGLV